MEYCNNLNLGKDIQAHLKQSKTNQNKKQATCSI